MSENSQFALLLLAAGIASVCITPLRFGTQVGPPPGPPLELAETALSTSIFCASLGLALHLYGPTAGFCVFAIFVIVNRSLYRRKHPRAERISAWASASIFLVFLAQIT